MRRGSRSRQRLGALALCGLPLLGFPILGLAQGEWLGWPAGFVYLFAVWAGLIGLAAWIAEGRGR
ncbi:MAG: hypothetical protein LWW83_12160 [Azonexaceae bacterium]|uniref:hypothetical protein n=1 Tax=Azonexus sp. R2A61 TaxID=2744443 RepID=UPI001F45BFE8|nr:hypothetical protein [Azonexus sp. R2A61]MCE1240666.1 hypothetical protein [Azonexaceae bacterium]